MKKINAGLVAEADSFVINLLETRLSEKFLFHCIAHTRFVLESAVFIGKHSGLTEDELNILRICALFHDVGYTVNGDDHEVESARIATEFLASRLTLESDIQIVEKAILSTKVPQHPGDLISEVLCDADLMHLTSPDYFEQMDLLRREWQQTGRYDLTEHEFHLNSIGFFNRHHYHTEFGRTIMTFQKEETLKRIRERVNLIF